MITEEEVKTNHRFVSRSICTLINGTAKDRLLNNKGDWIIIDNYYFNKPIIEIIDADGKKRYFQTDKKGIEGIGDIVKNNPKYSGCSVKILDACPNYSLLIKKLAEFLKENWGENIILIDSVESAYTVSPDEEIIIRKQTTLAKYYRAMSTKLLMDYCKCQYITIPGEVFSRDQSGVHYGFEIYEYVEKLIWEYTHWKDNSQYIICSAMATVQEKILGILHEQNIAKNVIISKINTIVSKRIKSEYTTAVDLCETGIKNGDAEYHLYKGIMLKKGIGYPKNIEESLKELKIAYELNVKNSFEELASALYSVKTNDSLNQLFIICNKNQKNNIAKGYLGRLYRDGNIVERNLDRSIFWYTNAVHSNVYWILAELLDELWKEHTNKTMNQCFEICLENQSKSLCQVYLGAIYKEGIVCPRDEKKSELYLEQAKKNGYYWENNNIIKKKP